MTRADTGPRFITATGTGTIALGPYRPSCFMYTDWLNACMPYAKVSSTAPFSPASYCPSGWTGGWTFYPSSYVLKSAKGTDTANKPVVFGEKQPDETMIICCPS